MNLALETTLTLEPNNDKRYPLPFRYPGGKFYALNLLRPFLCVEHDEFREPFVGGGTVFFNKPKSSFNWINDIDKELITTYQVMSNPILRKELVNALGKEIASKERWKEIFCWKPKNSFEIALRYYYLNRTSFSGKLISAAWGYRPKRSLPPERWQERILPCGSKLEGVKITNYDFEQVITAPSSGKQIFMFLDPPYFKPPKKKHYRNGFTIDDHMRLARVLKNTKYKFLLTYDDVDEIHNLYKWANINEVNFFYRVDNAQVQAGQRRLGFELVITNYDTTKQLNLF